jgi:geranylgeranyl diphosphate synthase type I
MLATIDDAERLAHRFGPSDLPIYNVLRYHLGYVGAQFQPDRSDPGKRVRPRLCVLTCAAAGGDPRHAIHMAAAIELLHNFTLIHDDIQDQSPLRRHRDTVWSRWGVAQAINAGDAMFAIAHLALNRSSLSGIDPATILRLSTELHQTTLRIVEGQVLDLGFEARVDVSASEYLEMISGKTAAITHCACWAGALIAGNDDRRVEQLAQAGLAIGIGFQLRDDLLGIWGDTAATGKAAADDIRRRKKSLPVLLLRDRASDDDRARIDALYAEPEIAPSGVDEMLQLLLQYEIQPEIQAEVERWHDRAASLIESALPANNARSKLEALVNGLVSRTG